MKRTNQLLLLVVAMMWLAPACGGEEGGGAELCRAVCQEQTDSGCQPFATLEQCLTLCGGWEVMGGDCLAEGDVFWQCQLDGADICDPSGCEAQGMAFSVACAGQ